MQNKNTQIANTTIKAKYSIFPKNRHWHPHIWKEYISSLFLEKSRDESNVQDGSVRISAIELENR